MSARDDYPPTLGLKFSDERPEYDAMCDEIDRLRAEIDALKIMYRADQMVRDAVDGLMRELTAHADAMCALLVELRDTSGHSTFWDRLDHAIRAYDDFVKEC